MVCLEKSSNYDLQIVYLQFILFNKGIVPFIIEDNMIQQAYA